MIVGIIKKHAAVVLRMQWVVPSWPECLLQVNSVDCVSNKLDRLSPVQCSHSPSLCILLCRSAALILADLRELICQDID